MEPRIPAVPPNCLSCFFCFFFFFFSFISVMPFMVEYNHQLRPPQGSKNTIGLNFVTRAIYAYHFCWQFSPLRCEQQLMDLNGAPAILLPDQPSILYLFIGTCWVWFIGHFLLGIFIEESCTFFDRI